MFLGYKGILFAAAAAVCFLNVNAVSITELSEITDPDGVYELSSDIVLDESFVQLGTEQAPFTGSFDGNGFTITVNGTSPFGFVKNAELSDFAVSGVVSSKENFGGIVGSAEGATTIKNCSFSGTLDSCGEGIVISAGGIAGTVGSEASVINCSSNVSLTCEKLPYLLNAGGISGRNQGTVSQCASSGELSVISEKYRVNLGGIVGENLGAVSGCSNGTLINASLGADSSQCFAGGIVGCNKEGSIERCINLGQLSGNGTSVYPVYAGGIVGVNTDGRVNIAKNLGSLTAGKTFAGGVAGMNLGYKQSSEITDCLNIGNVTSHDSVSGGIVGSNTKTQEEESSATVGFSLDLSDDKAVGNNTDVVLNVYNTGENDGASAAVTPEELKANGISALENHSLEWVNNSDIGALPDLLVISDVTKPSIAVSNSADGKIAYYLFSPDENTYASSFAAAFYEGNRYIGMSYVEKNPQESFTRLTADNIPENTTRIEFIAFTKSFSAGFAPAYVKKVEIPYSNN